MTRQNCPTGLSRLGTKLGLLGGARSWEQPLLCWRKMGVGLWEVVSGIYTAPSLRSGAHTLMSPRGSLAARPNQAGHEVRAGGGFPLWTPSRGQQAW